MPPIKPRKEYQNLNLPSMFESAEQPQVDEKQRRRDKSSRRRSGAEDGESGG